MGSPGAARKRKRGRAPPPPSARCQELLAKLAAVYPRSMSLFELAGLSDVANVRIKDQEGYRSTQVAMGRYAARGRVVRTAAGRYKLATPPAEA